MALVAPKPCVGGCHGIPQRLDLRSQCYSGGANCSAAASAVVQRDYGGQAPRGVALFFLIFLGDSVVFALLRAIVPEPGMALAMFILE